MQTFNQSLAELYVAERRSRRKRPSTAATIPDELQRHAQPRRRAAPRRRRGGRPGRSPRSGRARRPRRGDADGRASRVQRHDPRRRAGAPARSRRPTDKGAVGRLRRRDQILVSPDQGEGQGDSRQAEDRRRVTAKDMAIFTRQFATMIDAGLPLVQCLDILGRARATPRPARRHCADVERDGRGGLDPRRRARKHPKAFDDLFTNWSRRARPAVSSTRSSSGSPPTSRRPTSSSARSRARWSTRSSSSSWPSLVIVVHAALGHPDLREDVQGPRRRAAAAHPDRHRALRLVVQHYCSSWWSPASARHLRLQARTTPPTRRRRIIDTLHPEAAGLGIVIRKVAVARFTPHAGHADLLGRAHPGRPGASRRETAGNRVVEDAIMQCAQQSPRAEDHRRAAAGDRRVPAHGRADDRRRRAHRRPGRDAQRSPTSTTTRWTPRSPTLTALMEPMMIVFLGGVVGGFVIAMYLPIFRLVTLIK